MFTESLSNRWCACLIFIIGWLVADIFAIHDTKHVIYTVYRLLQLQSQPAKLVKCCSLINNNFPLRKPKFWMFLIGRLNYSRRTANQKVVVVQCLAHVSFTSATRVWSLLGAVIRLKCTLVACEKSASSLTLPNTACFSGYSGFLLYKHWTNEGWPLLDL